LSPSIQSMPDKQYFHESLTITLANCSLWYFAESPCHCVLWNIVSRQPAIYHIPTLPSLEGSKGPSYSTVCAIW